MDGGEEHTVALKAHHLPGRQIHNGHQRLAHQLLRLIELMNAGENLTVRAGTVIQREAQELFRLLHRFAGFDLDSAEVGLAECVEVHLFRELRLHLHGGQRGLAGSGLGGLQLLQRLVHIQAGEQVLALDHRNGLGQNAPQIRVFPSPLCLTGADLGKELVHALGHKRRQQCAADAGGLQQNVQHMGKPRAVGFHVLGQRPGGVLVDILVGALDDLENFRQRVVGSKGFHLVGVGLLQTGGLSHQLGIVQHGVHSVAAGGELHAAAHADHGGQLLLVRRGAAVGRQLAAKILTYHGGGAADKVAEVIGKVGVDGLNQQLVGEVAVGAEGERPHQEEAQSVHAKMLRQHIGVHHIALGLGHLASVQQQPAVAEYVLGNGLAEAHEHGGPDNRVEPHNFLADDVDAGPVFLVVIIAVILIAQRGDIVAQGVHPHVDNVLGVKVHGDAPGEAGAGNAQILETGIDEVFHHLIDAGAGLEEVGVLQQVPDTVSVLAQAEEVSLLLSVHHRAAAVGAATVLELALRPEGLAGSAVLALVGALIDIAVVIHPSENALDGLDMVVVRGADEAVIGNVHQLPQITDATGTVHNAVHKLLRRHTGLIGLLLDLLAVLIRAGEKHNVLALQAVIAGNRIRGHRAVGVADVQLIGGVIDRCCDIERIFSHSCIPRFYLT